MSLGEKKKYKFTVKEKKNKRQKKLREENSRNPFPIAI